MSLKTFHIFFIAVSVLLCLGLGVWCLRAVHEPAVRVAGALSFLAAAGLVGYEVYFLRKMRGLQ